MLPALLAHKGFVFDFPRLFVEVDRRYPLVTNDSLFSHVCFGDTLANLRTVSYKQTTNCLGERIKWTCVLITFFSAFTQPREEVVTSVKLNPVIVRISRRWLYPSRVNYGSFSPYGKDTQVKPGPRGYKEPQSIR